MRNVKDYEVALDLSVSKRWLLDGNLSRAWLHFCIAMYYLFGRDKRRA